MHPIVSMSIALLSCLGLSAAGCNRDRGAESPNASGPERNAVLGPRLETHDGPSGTPTPNGVKPEVYHQFKVHLAGAMGDRVTLAAGPDLSKAFDMIPKDPKATKLVEYTIDCALKGDFVFGTTPISGKGRLTTTAGWRGGPLLPDQQEALHVCIAARLNPSGKDVTIRLSGLNVIDESDEGQQYPVDEAYWASTVTENGMALINVWPSKALEVSCGNNLAAAVSTRVCGLIDPAACGLKRRDDRSKCVPLEGDKSECPRTPGQPAMQAVIRTRMKCSDWCTFYPGCNPPSACVDAGLQTCGGG